MIIAPVPLKNQRARVKIILLILNFLMGCQNYQKLKQQLKA